MPPQTNEGIQIPWNFLNNFWESLEVSGCAQEPVISLAEHYSSRPPLILSCNLLRPNSQRIHSSTKKNDGLCPWVPVRFASCPLSPELREQSMRVQTYSLSFCYQLLTQNSISSVLHFPPPTLICCFLDTGNFPCFFLFHISMYEASKWAPMIYWAPHLALEIQYWTMQI